MANHGEPSLDGQLSVVLVDAKNFDEREGYSDSDWVVIALHRPRVFVVAA